MIQLIADEIIDQPLARFLSREKYGRIEIEARRDAFEALAIDADPFEVAHDQAVRIPPVQCQKAVLAVRLQADSRSGEQAKRREDSLSDIGA